MFFFLQIKRKMRLFWLSLLFVQQIEINAQSISYSFVDLISHIVNSGRFVEENLIHFNLTHPSLNFNLNLHQNTSNCTRDIRKLTSDLLDRQVWALKSTNLLLSKEIQRVKLLFQHSILGVNYQVVYFKEISIGSVQFTNVNIIYVVLIIQFLNNHFQHEHVQLAMVYRQLFDPFTDFVYR